MRRISFPSDNENEAPSKPLRPIFKSRKRKVGEVRQKSAMERESSPQPEEEADLDIKVMRKSRVKMGVTNNSHAPSTERKSALEMLRRYNDYSVETAETAAVEAPTQIPDEMQIKELKERRYRAQLGQLESAKQQELDEDYDSEHEFKTRRDVDDDMDFDIDLDDRLGDGRFAVGAGEQRVQRLLRQEEIEEALYQAQLSEDEQELDYEAEVSRLKEHISNLQAAENNAAEKQAALQQRIADLSLQRREIEEQLNGLC
ncbi:hypothetical protein KL948_004398 [Ogataea haglerorum]|uniref:Uncharacterized protein n=1 Tax=Ogataea haglerorum TaxID=1937702 RepID=A0ABQ7RBV7_9ASCO|nr:hypothetical protein KL951_004619 [Ogataea haglerorum]KAG7703323.1 hypothetical protein KL914_004708 [Ogataea haglerorum]KAG7703829.1 hypothetical protein KL950_004626 [Ogataea haglerorum]KAG7727871.1 hypothetical protein KL948_004398 [Ogataea haglerorum]KAG7735616.1 hypothetical protein KL932_004280 [Ogataea haglerorum]